MLRKKILPRIHLKFRGHQLNLTDIESIKNARNQLFNLSVEHFIKFVSNKTLNNKAVFGVEKPLSNYVLDSQSLRFHPIAKCENDNVQHQNYKTKNVSFAMFTKTSLKFYASQ